MLDLTNPQKDFGRLGPKQRSILYSLHTSSGVQSVENFILVKEQISRLLQRNLITLKDDNVFLSELGQLAYQYWEEIYF